MPSTHVTFDATLASQYIKQILGDDKVSDRVEVLLTLNGKEIDFTKFIESAHTAMRKRSLVVARELANMHEEAKAEIERAAKMAGNRAGILNAVKAIEERAAELQKTSTPDSPLWHGLETIDDRVHDILTLMGE